MRVLAIIPARKGSKGVPGKNTQLIAGKPLIGYTIDAAVQCGALSNIIVSTDDETIWQYADNFNVTIHKRDPLLATDTSPVVLTVIEVIHFAEELFNTTYDAIMILQATAPLRELWHIHEAIKLLNDNPGYDCLISVVKTGDHHPARMYTIEEGVLHSLQPENEDLNRQQLPPVYLRNGSIYITRRDALLKHKRIMLKPALAYVMDEKYHLNIDEPRDMLLAKIIMEGNNALSNTEVKPTATQNTGINTLPASILNSKILTGSNIAQLAVVPVPFIDPSYSDDVLKNIIQYYSLNPEEMEKELHLHAKNLLDEGKVNEAWQVLLAGV